MPFVGNFSFTQYFRLIMTGALALGSVAFASAQSEPQAPEILPAQTPFSKMPKHDQYQKLIESYKLLRQPQVFNIQWAEDGKAFTYTLDGKVFLFDMATQKSTPSKTTFDKKEPRFPFQRQAPGRGRQYGEAFSPNGAWKAVAQDGNVELVNAKSGKSIPVTTEATASNRIKFGVASWVYGEELGVRDAMWFSPDNQYLGYYRYDESQVKDYFITYNQLDNQDTLNTEPYPLPGTPNPIASLLIYNVKTQKSIAVDSQFGDPNLGYYIFEVHWSPDGKELLYYRTNRLQNDLQFCAADPESGKSRVILEVKRTDGWVDTNRYRNLQPFWLKDKHRFIWIDDNSGYRNLYLYDIDGKELATLTHQTCDVESVESVDEKDGWVYYMARNGDNPYLLQLNRVKLDGTHDERLTDPKLSHTCTVSPIGSGFVDMAQDYTTPPSFTVYNGKDKPVGVLSTGSTTEFDKLHLSFAQRFVVKAADGKTDLYGYLELPSNFDPKNSYPMVCLQYGGPEAGGGNESFVVPNPLTEFGFVIMHVDCRGSSGRGRAFMVSVYHKLGQLEIDDEAAVVKQLCAKYTYLDPKRVGIEGTSYGGYFAALSILRHPETYSVSCASSPVTDFRLYDSIYTERYMGLPTPEDNEDGYVKGSCMTYAGDLKGRLMLYFGTADNNVHPSNTFKLAQALTEAGKRYDMMVGPDQGHSAMNYQMEWEYMIRNLILAPAPDSLNAVGSKMKSRIRDINEVGKALKLQGRGKGIPDKK